MEMKKVTKKENFGMVRDVVLASEVDNKQELLDFIDHELELLERKAENRKGGSSKKQAQDTEIKAFLLKELAQMGEPVTISELMKQPNVANYTYEKGDEMVNFSTSKISAMFKKMIEEDKTIIKTTEKGKTYFQVV